MRIYSITPYSHVNGPGKRSVIHFQGCHLNCVGCFNAHTHPSEGGQEISVGEIIKQLPQDIDGVTISGGEPFLQPKALLQLVRHLSYFTDSIVVFSGFYLNEILKIKEGSEILNHIDVLIDGRFDETQIAKEGLRGSSNQTIHILTERHTLNELQERNVEITFDENGTIHITGFPEENFLKNII